MGVVFRGKVYGAQALQSLEDFARSLHVQQIGLYVFGHNQRAHQLYRRLGYIETNIAMAKPLTQDIVDNA